MPRPKTKEDLLVAGETQFSKMWETIESLSNDNINKTFSFEDRDRNVRDVLVHLYEWDLLLLDWISSNLKGKQKHLLPDGYNWKTYPALNILFWEKHQSTNFLEAKTLLLNSHSKVMDQIDKFTNEELFTKKYYNWTGTTSLGSYCVSTTSSHYDWAFKKVKKHFQSCK